MKYELCYIGKTHHSYIEEGIEIYRSRLNHYTNFEIIRIDRVKNGHKLSPEELLKKESELILDRINNSDILILLDEKGKQITSFEFSNWLEKFNRGSFQRVIFQVGGVYGFHSNIREQGYQTLSLSKFTFPHEMVKLIFTEQLYRAFTILRNESYHNP